MKGEMRKTKVVGVLCLVFILGGLAGALAAGVYFKGRIRTFFREDPQARAERIVTRLARELDLKSEQREAIRVIVADSERRSREVRKEFEPRLRAIREQAMAKIRTYLTPEQRRRMEAFDRRLRRRFGLPRPWHGGQPPPKLPPEGTAR